MHSETRQGNYHQDSASLILCTPPFRIHLLDIFDFLDMLTIQIIRIRIYLIKIDLFFKCRHLKPLSTTSHAGHLGPRLFPKEKFCVDLMEYVYLIGVPREDPSTVPGVWSGCQGEGWRQ